MSRYKFIKNSQATNKRHTKDTYQHYSERSIMLITATFEHGKLQFNDFMATIHRFCKNCYFG